MSATQGYPYPQVFVVDSGGGQQASAQPPGLVPCWSYLSAQEKGRERYRTRGGSRFSSWSLVLALLFLLLLVFGALGLGAYQIHKLQTHLDRMQQEISTDSMVHTPEKLVGDLTETGADLDRNSGKAAIRPAAHLIGRIENNFSHNTLRWEPKAGRAFTQAGVIYRDGGLQVNETGLYHIYTRVEFRGTHCNPTDSLLHYVFARRPGNLIPLTLMKAHREGYCFQASGSSFWSSGSYLGATLQLEKQDWVYVNVSHPALISHVHYANFFGLHKV
ncbi:hypothetical protein UPYG_G00028710 [Umbra pygmaea]|uniref:THD domain-containing protein n=1 Tax=Umbra pygmaea TaxID=75934 RepID=A0ABD0Y300_UMBPY